MYLINATLMSGVDTLLVSNDRFRDHLHHVASSHPAMIRLLKQWQLGSQVKMLFKNGSLFALVVSEQRSTKVVIEMLVTGHFIVFLLTFATLLGP